MKIFSILIFSLKLFSFSCFAQCEAKKHFDISLFLKNCNTQKTTFYFKAKFGSLGKISQYNTLVELSSKKIINRSLYKSALSITTLDSNYSFYMPFKDVDNSLIQQLIKFQGLDKIICVKAIMIKNFQIVNKKPFFLIEKIWFD